MSKVILLNGASSSGKSSIAKHLQDILEAPFFHINVDLVLDITPSRLKLVDPLLENEALEGFYWTTYDNGKEKYLESKTGITGQKLVRAVYLFIKTLIDSEINLIIDDVFFSQERIKTYLELINHNDVYLIGVKCNLQQLEYRENLRSDRRIGEARGQYHLVHENINYDFTVDTTNLSSLECAWKIASFISEVSYPHAFKKLRAEYNFL